ncbi:MAG: DUF2339 domain-containing protein [Acidobacteriota bacterium]|nr:DUF2339 domain-containing protein [Acidobacteriota bacterium]
MQSGWELLVFLAVVAFFAGPILAIIALARISALRGEAEQVRRLTSRVFELEQRAASLGAKHDSPVTPGQQAHAAGTIAPQPQPSEIAPIHWPISTPPRVAAQNPAPTLHTPVAAHRPSAAASASERGHTDVEAVLGGKWLYYLGILALIFAVAFFLKYAFDSAWIGPSGRMGIGIVIGGAMFPLSDWLLHRGYRYFSEGITGFGAAILYLSIWSGWHYFALFSQPAAFSLMIVITALAAVVAILRNSQRIAFVALAGGALTPFLASTGENAELTLFLYLLILGAGMLAICWAKDWKWLPPLQFAATLIYFWGWYANFYAVYEMGTTLVFAAIFFALFAALPALRGTREGQLSPAEVAIVIANAVQFLVALRFILWPEYRWWLAFAVLALAAAHVLAERVLPEKTGNNVRVARTLYAGLALMFATVAIPILLDDQLITIAWAVEGAALVWSGLRVRSLALRATGILLLAVAAIRLAAFPIAAGGTLLLNARFLTMAVCAACFLAAFGLASRSKAELRGPEMHIYYVIAIVANVLFLAALSLEIWDFYGRTPSIALDRSLAQNLALSVLWLVYAILLLVGGVIRKSAVARWQALALLGVVVVKVFFFDLSFLARFYRIVSFFLLGLALLLVSFFYQRRSASRAGDKAS